MSDALIDIVGVVPAQMVLAYAFTRLLVIRHVRVYMVLQLVLTLTVAVFRSGMPPGFRLGLTLAFALLPFAMSQGGVSRRLLVVVLAHIVLFFAEVPSSVAWVAMTGTPIASYDAVREHFGAFAATHAVHLALLVLLLVVLHMLLDRSSSDKWRRSARLLVAFSLIQMLSMNLAILLPLELGNASGEFYAGCLALSLLCLAVDVALFIALDRFANKRKEDQRADMLEDRLDRYLEQCHSVVDAIERTLQLRHDVRNQAQVAYALANQGRCAEAREHIRLLQSSLSECER